MTDIHRLRAIGHGLSPVVTLGVHGLTDAVRAELERALAAHELIKVRLATGDRHARAAMLAGLARGAGAAIVGSVGRNALLYRANPAADPRLSNVARAAVTGGQRRGSHTRRGRPAR